MDWTTIITGILSFVAGGGLLTIVTVNVQKKKMKAGVKADEIENLRNTVESVYKPLIEEQNSRIATQSRRINELEAEVKTLRDEKHQMELAYQRQIADLQKQITEITRALGIKAAKQLRNAKGQYTSEREA